MGKMRTSLSHVAHLSYCSYSVLFCGFIWIYKDETTKSVTICLLSGDVRSAVSWSKPQLASLENSTSAAINENCLLILNI